MLCNGAAVRSARALSVKEWGGLPATTGVEGAVQLDSHTAQPRIEVTDLPNLLDEELLLLCNTEGSEGLFDQLIQLLGCLPGCRTCRTEE